MCFRHWRAVMWHNASGEARVGAKGKERIDPLSVMDLKIAL